MSENLKKFLDLIASNKELEAKALACNELGEEKGKQAFIELAKENGIEITLADFEKKEAAVELNDDELDAVAGGTRACGCFAGGFGIGTDANDGNTFGCGCARYGQGGDGKSANDCNCFCAVFGLGEVDAQLYK